MQSSLAAKVPAATLWSSALWPVRGVGGRWQTRAMSANIGTPGGTPERPAIFFSGPEEFRAWLDANHDTETELWMGLYKKHVAERPHHAQAAPLGSA